MDAVNIYEAKRQFSRLVQAAAEGETIVIARAGTPVARLVRVDAEVAQQRLGFLAGQATVPEDFDRMDSDELSDLFEGV